MFPYVVCLLRVYMNYLIQLSLLTTTTITEGRRYIFVLATYSRLQGFLDSRKHGAHVETWQPVPSGKGANIMDYRLIDWLIDWLVGWLVD